MTAPPRQARSDMLMALIDSLNRSEVPYCILHGYLGYPDDVPSDVKETMTFHPVMTLGEVLELALEPAAEHALP